MTVGARTACLSSFYKFLIRMGMLASNPCDALERPKAQPSPARGYTATDVQRVLALATVPVRDAGTQIRVASCYALRPTLPLR